MRILAFTDIHGAYDRVNEILAADPAFDVMIIGGDLTTFGTPEEADSAVKQFQRHGKPLLLVAGNMDPPALETVFKRENVSINGHGIIIDDTGFFGVSAAPYSVLKTPYEISEEEIKARAEAGWRQVEKAPRKVFVPHAPPYNTALDKVFSGKHVGSTAVREFIERRQPDVAVCGHIHEARGIDHIGGTIVVNCGPAGRRYYTEIVIEDQVFLKMHG
jgi:Icc-related predicted phosphoesterase